MSKDQKALVEEAWTRIREAGKGDPHQRFQRMVDKGIIDPEGRPVRAEPAETDPVQPIDASGAES